MQGEAGIIRRLRQRATREHWPKASIAALAYQGIAMAAVNAYLLWLAWHAQISPLSLAVFSVGELFVLAVFARVELIPVPRAQRFSAQQHALLGAEQRSGIFGRLFVCVFIAVWVTLVYAFCLSVDVNLLRLFVADHDSLDVNLILLVSAHDPLDVLTQLHVLWPLLLTAALAVVAMLGDWHLWHRRGGLFVPEMAQPNTPKILTFFVAPIPAVMACFTFIDDDYRTALVAWCLGYLAIRILFELGMLALSIFGLYLLEGADLEGPAVGLHAA